MANKYEHRDDKVTCPLMDMDNPSVPERFLAIADWFDWFDRNNNVEDDAVQVFLRRQAEAFSGTVTLIDKLSRDRSDMYQALLSIQEEYYTTPDANIAVRMKTLVDDAIALIEKRATE